VLLHICQLKGSRMGKIAVAVMLLALLETGCATRRGSFTSNPPGALVTVDSIDGITPCLIELPAGPCTAVVTHPDGGSRIVQICDGPWTSRRVLAGTMPCASAVLKGASVPFYVVGGGCLGLLRIFGYFKDDHYLYYPERRSSDGQTEDLGWGLFKIGIVGLGAGSVLYIGSKAIDRITPEVRPVVVHIDFTVPCASNAVNTRADH